MNAIPMEITCADTKAKLDAGDNFLFLDCREQNEFDQVNIAGTTLLPMSETAARVGELDEHKNSEVIVHCHHGGRSLRVAQFLREQGFAKTQSMAGGIDQWAIEIDTNLDRY